MTARGGSRSSTAVEAAEASKGIKAVRAVKAGRLALSGLARDPRPARVDSLYRTAINVTHGGGGLVCLHPEGVPLHPYSLVIGGETCWAGPASPFRGIRPGDRALVSSDSIDFGHQRPLILLGEAEVWDSRLCSLGAAGASRALRMLKEVWRVVLGEEVPGGVTGGVRRSPERLVEDVSDDCMISPFLGAIAQAKTCRPVRASGGIADLMRSRAERLIREMALECRSRSEDALGPLLGEVMGFGPGLTPSGDDFILGLVAAACAFGGGRRDAIEAELARLVTDASATAGYSQHMLRAAIDGHFPEPVMALATALGQTTTERGAERVRTTTRELVTLGSTSGQDMLAGIIFWLETCHELRPEPAWVGAA